MRPTNFLAPEGVHLPKLPEAPRDTEHHPIPRRRKKRRSLWRFVIVLSVFALLLGGIFFGISGSRIVKDALALKEAGEAAKTALENGDIEAAHLALGDVVTNIHEVRADLDSFAFLKRVPYVGDQVRGLEATLDAGAEAADALYSGLTVFLDALNAVEGASGLLGAASGEGEDRSYSDLTDEEKYILLHSLSTALPELRRMQVNLRLAKLDLDRLDSLNLAPAFANAVLPLKEKLPELINAVDIVVPFAAISPEFAGLGHDRQFLALFMNNHELRPGGGFIGNYGLLVMKNGDIKSLETDDAYNVDAFAEGKDDYFVAPPEPMRRYLIPEWYFRDSNWSPDFSQSSRDATQLFRQEFAYGRQPVPEIHGVIGITTDFLERVIGFVGPITVENETFTEANVTDRLEYIVEQAYDCANAPPEERATCVDVPEEERKLIIKKMSEVMVERLKSLSPSDWPEFFRLLHTAFARKEIVLMSFDEKTQATLLDAGWAGVLNPIASDDVLMTVDANLGAYKTDRVVDRHVTYAVRPFGNGYRATTSITYTNTAKKRDYRTKDYRTYTRVYAPLGSTLVATSGSYAADPQYNPQRWPDTPIIQDELGMTSFGAFTYVPLGETHTLSFTYDLPQTVVDAIKRGDYELQVYKQVGARDNLLTLDIDFGKAVREAVPPEDPLYWGDRKYHVNSVLETDKQFRVRL